ncbi:hypothetical protein M3223_06050 [Paenibacillus pasadenensis]|uniref:hypothetical protein n=1 Tax=Paenibacillus pasadenensis TaxID=217090 RepID=UPI00203A8F5A|nr:hypothetical protein [Paenibacillus pasadenensis]MCM3746915.1 hypothetical protein [Paenibacillus pasadenensis]
MGHITGTSNDQGSNIGVILVLFLLLIIVKCPFYVIQPVDESYSLTANPGFYITNNTSNIRLNVTLLTDSASPPTPTSILIPNGGENRIELSGQLSLGKTLRGSVRYNAALSNSYISIGNLSFTLEQTLTKVGYDTYLFSSITGISSTAPVRWNTTSTRLTIVDA